MNDSLVGVKNGSVTLNPDEYPYEELRDMALQINALASDIGTHMNRLRDERNKVSFILDNISEGFILMDGNQNILLINNSACAYMRCDKNVIGHEVSHCTQNYDFLQTADDVARCRMNSLINDIIMINRLESGELSGEKENVDLSAVIRDCCDEIKPLAEQMGLTVNTVLGPVKLYADRKNAYEMVSNLVMNAVKYNKQGGRVDVSLKTEEAGIILTVRNDGEIIPPEHRHRVFERFYRVDKGRSKTVGGTGLGLSIVKHVVDTLGGTIRLESNEKNGTTFTVKIPIQDTGDA